ncbi:MAG: hypothetical protein SPI34_01270 [Opitutales bacterium]|nr:hypothetical protein [Opitutales bacterium]
MAVEDNPDFAEKTVLNSNPVKLSQVEIGGWVLRKWGNWFA